MQVSEINIAANEKLDIDTITEAGKELVPLSGPGYVGLKNLGNSCYMNSVVQVLLAMPEVASALTANAATLYRTAPDDPSADLLTQLAKLAEGVLTPQGAAAAAADADAGAGGCVVPRMLKMLVGKGHPEFSSARQQDAQEYMQHLLELVARAERTASSRVSSFPSLSALTTHSMEERIEADGMACYRTVRGCTYLSLPIPTEAATNRAAVEAYEQRASLAKRQRLDEGAANAADTPPLEQLRAAPAMAELLAAAQKDTASVGASLQQIANNDAALLKLIQENQGDFGALLNGTAPPAPAPTRAPPAAEPAAAEEEAVVPSVPFEACLAKFAAPEQLESFRGRQGASKTTKFKSFPPYLVVHLRRYYVGDDWTAKKLKVQVPVPESIDLSAMRGSGPAEGEALLPEAEAEAPAGAAGGAAGGGGGAAGTEPDETIVAQLISMGFSENGCKRAAVAVKNANAEVAMEWVFAHMEDSDFNDPLPPPGAADAAAGGGGGGGGGEPDPEKVSSLVGMGFTPEQAAGALAATSGSLERAADWLFSHMDDLDSAVAAALSGGGGGGVGGGGGGAAAPASEDNDGGGAYDLLGFISHMGANTSCGHYVCHIKKEGRWALYNDRKVAASENTPLEHGYMYVFKRRD